MPTLKTAQSTLHYECVELTSPWIHEPDTIVFHHGIGAHCECWREWYGVLAARFRLVALDMRGHGATPASTNADIDSLVADLDEIVRGPGGGHCHVVGESIGGTVALAYAARHPERVKSLTVSNSAHVGGSLENLANWRDLMREGMQHWSEHMMSWRFREGALSDDMWQWYCDQQARADKDFVLAAVEALAGADLGSELEQIVAPVLIMHPDASPFIPLEVSLDLKRKLRDARLQVFANTQHGLPFSHARACSEVLLEFLVALK